MAKSKKRLAILASGSGTNAENIAKHFASHKEVQIARVYTNRPTAGVIKRAHRLNIPCVCFTKQHLTSDKLLLDLQNNNIDGIILAGFMQLIPSSLIQAFPDAILNIHPSLLPKYGGKGMYGEHVHKAVIDAGEKESGITVHVVNERYDEGRIVLQEKILLEPDETPESLAAKIHELEYLHYPRAIETIFN